MSTSSRDGCIFLHHDHEIDINYYEALTWFMGKQNRDGSWGKTKEEKILVTCHAVMLMSDIGLESIDKERVNKAIHWLQNNISRTDSYKSTKHPWIDRLAALLEAGKIDWIIKHGEMEYYMDRLVKDEKNRIYKFHPGSGTHAQEANPGRGEDVKTADEAKQDHQRMPDDFFWYVVPVFYNINRLDQAGKLKIHSILADYKFDTKIIVDEIGIYSDNEGRSDIKVGGKANHTGFAASYLNSTHIEQYDEAIEKMIEHLRVTVQDSEQNQSMSWNGSIGATSYVLMDLAHMNRLDDPRIRLMVNKAIRFFKTENEGGMRREKEGRGAFDTEIHESKLYLTALALRAMSLVLSHKQCFMRKTVIYAAADAVNRNVIEDLKQSLRHSFDRAGIGNLVMKVTRYALAVSVAIYACLYYVVEQLGTDVSKDGFEASMDWLSGIVLTLIGAMIGYYLQGVKRDE